jgi:hypothetical protein
VRRASNVAITIRDPRRHEPLPSSLQWKRPPIERAVRAVTGRLLSATAGSRPVLLPDFGEAVQTRGLRPLIVQVLSPARLTMIVIDKILAAIEREN